ncbi:MAG: hypothetical protein JKY95_04885 [Planctomycetaceae bacterium]|nr:hypothetical protein [Planctomycetaceae bacterium]
MSLISRDNFQACSQQVVSQQIVPTCWGKIFWLYSISLLAFLVVNAPNLSVVLAQDEAAKKEAVAEVNTEELVTTEEVGSQRKLAPNYYKAISKTSLSQSEVQAIKNYTRIQVLQMSLESKKRELPNIRKKIKRDFSRAKQPGTDLLLSEITAHCQKLLNHPMPVRLNAVMLISELNQSQGNIGKKEAAIPYEGKADTLLAIVKNPVQSQAVKVIAVRGLDRLCKDASLKVDLRKKIASSLIVEIKKANIQPWYKLVCVETLGSVDDLYDTQRKPYIIQALCEVLIDNKQPWLVRAEAAHSLGRTKMDANTNVALINHEVARFAYDLSLQFNRNTKLYYWKKSFFQVYTTYRKLTQQDTAFLDRVSKAPLSKHKTNVEAAYKVILPVVNEVVGQPSPQTTKISKTALEKLKDFIDNNPPASLSVAPGSKPLRQAAAVPVKKEN